MNLSTQKHDEPRWTADDVAAYLKCSKSKVYKAAENGTLPAVRLDGLLRFDPETIRAYARGDLKPRPRVHLLRVNAEQGPHRG